MKTLYFGEYPDDCRNDDCDAPAYHLSTVNGHWIKLPTVDELGIWEETRQYKCREGHISRETVQVKKSLKVRVRR